MQEVSGRRLSRRALCRNLVSVSPGLGASALLARPAAAPQNQPAAERRGGGSDGYREADGARPFLNKLTYTRAEVDTFLDSNEPNFAKFDPELGYLLRNHVLKNGVDGSRSTVTFAEAGHRTMINHASRPCRINAYGDSFTQGFQVSDGETWPEYLAAHFGEPVRNFGIGGFGVYQAYRRMLREEATASGTPYMLFNIYGLDDHFRSIDAWRWLRFGEWWRTVPGHLHLFHGNPWAHVRLDVENDQLLEKNNPYPTPQSLYRLTEKDHVVERFQDDPIVKLLATEREGTPAHSEEMHALGEALGVLVDLSSQEATKRTARALRLAYALRTSIHIVTNASAFAQRKGKKLMVVLCYDAGTTIRACEGQPRPDQVFVNFLKDSNIRFVDVLAKHVEDFRAFHLPPREYVNRYYIGHYKPLGNHFFAFAIKDALVDWLDPKPLTYRKGSETIPP